MTKYYCVGSLMFPVVKPIMVLAMNSLIDKHDCHNPWKSMNTYMHRFDQICTVYKCRHWMYLEYLCIIFIYLYLYVYIFIFFLFVLIESIWSINTLAATSPCWRTEGWRFNASSARSLLLVVTWRKDPSCWSSSWFSLKLQLYSYDLPYLSLP